MSFRLCLFILVLALAGCASTPDVAESPIEAAQRRMAAEPPLIVAEGCFYQRNLLSFNRYLRLESRQLADEAIQPLISAFATRQIKLSRFTVPLMCASVLPPRLDDKDGRVSDTLEDASNAEKRPFPQALNETVATDAGLRDAYQQLFAACAHARVRKENRYDCPLLTPAQATLLKSRLKSPYVLALSVAADRASAAHKTSQFAFGLLLGIINFPEDAGTVRVRLVNLESGALVWSSFPGEFTGDSPSDAYYGVEGSRSRYDDLKLVEDWAEKKTQSLFKPQRR